MSQKFQSLAQLMQARRSIREYDAHCELDEDRLSRLLDLARYVPTSFNLQHERFLVVKDSEKRQKIRQAAWNQKQVTEASALVVVCADLEAWKKSEAVFANAPQDIQDLYVKQLIPDYYSGNQQIQRDEGFRSASMAAYALMLAAQADGLSTCPIGGFDFDAVGKMINLPASYVIVMMVAIGQKKEEAKPRFTQHSLNEFVTFDQF